MIGRILAPLDGSLRAEAVLPLVVRIATAFGARLDLLTVVAEGRPAHGEALPDPLAYRFAQADASRYLRAKQLELRDQELKVRTIVDAGEPAEAIVGLSQGGEYDLVALTPHGMGCCRHLRMGSTATAVVLNARTSILMAPSGGDLEAARAADPASHETKASDAGPTWILVPVDVSPRSDWSVTVAAGLAREGGGKIRLVHVLSAPEILSRLPPSRGVEELAQGFLEANRAEAQRYMEETTERLRGEGLVAEGLIIRASGSPADTLCDHVAREQPDLIVLGAHGRGASPQWPYGGTAAKLIFWARQPILLLQDYRGPRELPERAPETVQKSWPRGPAGWRRESAL